MSKDVMIYTRWVREEALGCFEASHKGGETQSTQNETTMNLKLERHCDEVCVFPYAMKLI